MKKLANFCGQMVDFAGLVTYVTGFQETIQIVTLGLFHFIGPVNGYTSTLQCTQPLPGLVYWSAFLERVLLTL